MGMKQPKNHRIQMANEDEENHASAGDILPPKPPTKLVGGFNKSAINPSENIGQIGNLPQIGGGNTYLKSPPCSLFFIAPKIEVGYLSKHVKQLEISTTYISKSKKGRYCLFLASMGLVYLPTCGGFMTNVDVGNYAKHG